MTNIPNNLPSLEGNLSLEDMFRHMAAGNVVGYVVTYGLFHRLEMEQQTGTAALARAVVARYAEINYGIPEAEQELGSDFAFYDASEDTAAIDFVPDEDDEFSPMPLPLSTEDVEHLLAHMPDTFLSRLVTEAEY